MLTTLIIITALYLGLLHGNYADTSQYDGQKMMGTALFTIIYILVLIIMAAVHYV